MKSIRPTRAVVRILKAFLDKLDNPPGGLTGDHFTYGYELMGETGFASSKVYAILLRLDDAGWLDRHTDPDAKPESGGPPRNTFQLKPEAVPAARRLVAEAQKELAPPRKRRSPRAVRAMAWLS